MPVAVEPPGERKDPAQRWLAAVERFAQEHGGRDPSWLAPVRRSAVAQFAERGFPGPLDEDWRFTSVERLVRVPFAIARAADADVSAAELQPLLFGGDVCARLVFVNGHFVRGLSKLDDVPAGLRVGSLGDALRAHPDVLEPHLSRYADLRGRSFAALNTALFADGAFLHVGRGRAIEKPVHLLFLSVGGAAPVAAQPRNLIVAEESSQLAVVEQYASLRDGVTFTNAVTELVVRDDATVEHYKPQQESASAFHVHHLRTHQARSSNLRSHTVTVGGGLVRNDLHAVLDGEGSDCTLNGLFVTHDEEHVDNHLRVEHVRPHCNSWEFYKGILDGRSSGVFTGRIFVHKAAQKTDAKQSNMNLLLSEQATIDTRPQLEIFADDVRCTHGATIGQIDPDAVFYLRSRGIEREAARSLLIYAFAGENLGQILIEPLREQLQQLVLRRLPRGELLRTGSPLLYGRDFSEHVKAADRRRESY